MTDAEKRTDGADGPTTHRSTRAYLAQVFLDRLSVAGITTACLGGIVLRVTEPASGGGALGGGLLLVGVTLFALGFTRVQRTTRE